MKKKTKNRIVIVASLLTIIIGIVLIIMGQTKTITGLLAIDLLISYGSIGGLFPIAIGLASLVELSERASKKPRR